MLESEASQPPCPSFQMLFKQWKNLGHQLSSPNLSITVTLDQWCRTHPSSPAGPFWTGLAQSSPSYRCQASQLTASCRWSWFFGPATGRCQQSLPWQWVAVWYREGLISTMMELFIRPSYNSQLYHYAWGNNMLERRCLTLTWECPSPAVHRQRWRCG